MRLRLIVKTKSKHPGVTVLTDTVYEVRVSAPPVGGRANDEVIAAIAEYFHVHKNQAQLISGFTASNKVVEVIV